MNEGTKGICPDGFLSELLGEKETLSQLQSESQKGQHILSPIFNPHSLSGDREAIGEATVFFLHRQECTRVREKKG